MWQPWFWYPRLLIFLPHDIYWLAMLSIWTSVSHFWHAFSLLSFTFFSFSFQFLWIYSAYCASFHSYFFITTQHCSGSCVCEGHFFSWQLFLPRHWQCQVPHLFHHSLHVFNPSSLCSLCFTLYVRVTILCLNFSGFWPRKVEKRISRCWFYEMRSSHHPRKGSWVRQIAEICVTLHSNWTSLYFLHILTHLKEIWAFGQLLQHIYLSFLLYKRMTSRNGLWYGEMQQRESQLVLS